MTTKPEHGQWSLAWPLESFLACEGYSCKALCGHIVINFIFSWKRHFPWLVKMLITITKLIILISRMLSWVDPVINLILLSKLDHEGTMSRQTSWYTYIGWPHDVMVLCFQWVCMSSIHLPKCFEIVNARHTHVVSIIMCLKQCICLVFLNVLHLTYLW